MHLTPRVIRSGESRDSFAAYRAAGVNTIIDLRSEPHAVADERAHAQAAGFRYVNIPLSIDSSAPDYLRAERAFFAVVDDPASGVVAFHCRHGKDRTGLMAALYRVRRQGWTPARAITEWRSLDGYSDDWSSGIRTYFVSRMRMLSAPRACEDVFRTAPASP